MNPAKVTAQLPRPQTSEAPMFRQIVDALRQQIVDRALPEHAPLPSKRVVAEQFNVSRMTSRRALEVLELEGLAYSEQRRGRFVSPPRLTYDISRMISFSADALATGIELEQVIRDDAGKPFCTGFQMWRGELAEFSARAFVNQNA